jgi:phosphatidylglycerophosphatase A
VRPWRLGRRFLHFVAFGFGSGASPIAPGTFGTLAAVPIQLALQAVAPGEYLIIVAAMLIAGVWICRVTERDLGTHDPGGIVWDEIVGFQVAMFLAPPGWGWMVVGFALFRFFDIWKPFPIRTLEARIPGAWGTMLDDVAAGLYGMAGLQAAAYLYSAFLAGEAAGG